MREQTTAVAVPRVQGTELNFVGIGEFNLRGADDLSK